MFRSSSGGSFALTSLSCKFCALLKAMRGGEGKIC